MARRYHHGALAEAMVEQALADVRRHGVDQVSLRHIAQALDVSPSAAYNHFADKESLLRAVGACGIAALDERMARALAPHAGDSDEAAMRRFAALGRAYVAFAVDEPHLFRLVFGPTCVELMQAAEDTGPYRKLCSALDELDRRRLLRRGIRPGLDVTIWAATHGMAYLVIEGALPVEAGSGLPELVSPLVLTDRAKALLAASESDDSDDQAMSPRLTVIRDPSAQSSS